MINPLDLEELKETCDDEVSELLNKLLTLPDDEIHKITKLIDEMLSTTINRE